MIEEADHKLGPYSSIPLGRQGHWCIKGRGKFGGQKSLVYMGLSMS